MQLDGHDIAADGRFLARLARSLVRDVHDSEDLVQQAWASVLAATPPGAPALNRPGEPALNRPGEPPLDQSGEPAMDRSREPAGLRAWLARVVRNRAASVARDRERRRARETEVARGAPASVAGEVGEALELQGHVLDAVRALREPYRTAIYLRYFDELEPGAIAERLGVPASTVHTRLVRGREELRERLEHRLGRGAPAMLALLFEPAPPAPVPGGVPLGAAPLVGAITVGIKLKLVLVLGLSAAALGAWRWRAVEPASEPVGAVDALAPAPAAEPAGPGGGALGRSTGARAPVAPVAAAPRATRTAAVEPGPAPPVGLAVRGRVLDATGEPLASVRVRFEADEADAATAPAVEATSNAGGAFELAGVGGSGEVRTDDPSLVTVLAARLRGDGLDGEANVVAAPRGSLAVDVVDELGRPVAGARVSLAVTEELRRALPVDASAAADVAFEARSDVRGRAELGAVPLVPGSRLRGERDGFAAATVRLAAADLPAPGASRVAELVLAHLEHGASTLAGSVVDEHGDGVAGALVTYGLADTTTDAAGRFWFDLAVVETAAGDGDDPAARHELCAVRAGYRPAFLRPRVVAAGAEPVWPEPIVLRPTERPLAVAGRVVDHRGQPLEGWTVFLREAHLLAGGRTLEGTAAGSTTGFVHSVRTDVLGRFELGGLLDREYAVAAIDEATLLRGDAPPVPAGTRRLELVVDTRRVWERVSGRVVDRRGAALAGAVVEPYCTTQWASGAQGRWCTSAKLEPVRTAEDGTFELVRIPREHVQLGVQHPDILDRAGIDLDSGGATARGDALSGLRVEVSRRMGFQVLLGDPAEADRFRILDAGGAELRLLRQTADSYFFSGDYRRLVDGRSEHLFVEETAAVLVLERDGAEVRRVELDLVAGAENRLRL